MTFAPREQLVDVRQPASDRILRQPLQVKVERCIDVNRLRRHRREAGILFRERLVDEVDEIRRFGFERALHDDERLLRRALGDLAGDVP